VHYNTYDFHVNKYSYSLYRLVFVQNWLETRTISFRSRVTNLNLNWQMPAAQLNLSTICRENSSGDFRWWK